MWVTGVVRGIDGQLRLRVKTEIYGEVASDLERWKSDVRFAKTDQVKRLQVDFGDFRPVDLQPYVKSIGWPSLSTLGQTGFEATTSEGTVLIPSQVMILGVFGCTKSLRELLFKPLDAPNEFHREIRDRSKLKHPHQGPMVASSHAARREWISLSQSATAAWGSVYRYALEGRFDMKLPKGVATFIVRGEQVGQTLMASRVTLLGITLPSSECSLADRVLPQSLVFHKLWDERVSRPAEDKRLRAASLTKLSDAQWEKAKFVLSELPDLMGRSFCEVRRTVPLRDCLDAIRYKLGTPCPWLSIPDFSSPCRARDLYVRLDAANLWDRVVEVTSHGFEAKA